MEEFCAGELSLQFCLEHLRAVFAFCWSKKASVILLASALPPLLSGESKSANRSARGALGSFLDGRGEQGNFRLDLSSSSLATPMNLTGVVLDAFLIDGESPADSDIRCSVSGSRCLSIDFFLSALL